MNETELNTTNDSSGEICRICLQVHENMINIFDSRIDIQLMEVTNLKVMSDDKLPKVLCQNCQSKLIEYFNFLKLAKSSDSYLRSKITTLHKPELKNEICKEKEVKKLNKELEEYFLKSEISRNEEYMYFIVVPNEGHDVYVEKLNCETSNAKVIDFCKNYMKTHTSGDNYLNNVCGAEFLKKDSKVFEVDMDIYKCNLCGKGFPNTEDLISNCTHNLNLSITCAKYKCPVCCWTEVEKAVFLKHLKNHEKEGFVFTKINLNEEKVLMSEGKKDMFKSETNSESDCKVFLLNLKNFVCEMCTNCFESKDLITEHLKSCLFNITDNFDFLIIYTCPVCQCEFKNDESSFVDHLKSHKSSKIYFINVNNDGVPVEIAQDDLFLPYAEAVEVYKVFGKKVFKIFNLNSCDECDFVTESFEKLSEHYKNLHKFNKIPKKSFSCPVCLNEFVGDEADKLQIDFYNHLRIHKSEGFGFVLLNKNNILVECSDEFSDVFTNSNVVLSVLNHSLENFEVLSPETHFSDGVTKFSCDICSENFKKKKDIIKHIKTHFNEKSKYICEKCGKKCKGKLNYKKHFMNHFTTERKKTCMICNKTFAKRATLNGHLRQHIKEGTCKEDNPRIICEKCGKNFSSNAGLTKHKKLHLKDKENDDLKCEICGRSFVSEASFERHKSAHFNPKYFECEVCKLPLPSLTILQKHSLVHKSGSGTFDCKMCKISFLTKDSLTAHQTHTGHYVDRTPLECNVCHEKFFVGRKFTEHIKTHPKYKVGECTLCGKRLATIQSLMLHMNRHFESHSILCPHCGKTFFEEGNYHRHLLTHKGIKPFSCDIESCKKSFYTFSELNRHKRYHNNTRDFRCTYCSKSFHEANHLTVHVRTHTGERPYICPHCNKGFITRTRCKQHIKLVHQGIGYDLIRSSISKKVTVFEAIEAPA